MNEEDELVEEIPSEEEDKETGVPLYKIVSYPADPTLEVLYQKWQRDEILIESYINEYGFRYNHRKDNKPMFLAFLNQINK